jgi:hypothetical protein
MMVKGICTAVKHRASPLQSSAVHLVFAFCSPRKYFQGLEIGLSKEKSAVKRGCALDHFVQVSGPENEMETSNGAIGLKF